MNTKALWSITILGTVAAFFSACGDGDATKIKICNAKQLTCLNDQGGQMCSADGTQILPFECGSGQHCCDPNVKGSDCGEDVTKVSCVGDCEPGATQCGSKGVSLRCSDDGRRWVPTDCPVGTGCDANEDSDTYGTCVNSTDPDDVVVVCTGGDALCADGTTAKNCEPDGTNWVYTACATNEVCDDGACVLDPAKGCVPHSGTCQDLTHIKMCNDDGDGYEDVEECPDGTTCEDGACQGPVCPVGAIRCDDVRVGAGFYNALATGTYKPQAVYHCNDDGTAWEISSCASNEICIYDNISNNTVNTFLQELLAYARGDSLSSNYPVLVVPDSSRAACMTPECASPFALRSVLLESSSFNPALTAGSFTCGDGRDPSADPFASFSLCEGLPPYNNLYWANYACAEPEKCVYDGNPYTTEEGTTIVGPTCAADCVAGSTACTSPGNGTVGGVSTSGEATVTCGDDGSWDFSTMKKCLSKDNPQREWWCGPNLQGTSDNYNIGTCMEPACAAWFGSYNTFTLPEHVGACGTDGKFYPCNPDGTFGDAEDCSQCDLAAGYQLPSVTNAAETFAGYDPGTCIACTDGAQRCVFTSGQTPYYQVCDKGIWSTRSCSSSRLCWEYQDPDTALGSIVCGGECAPFTAFCGGTDGQQIATCSEDGELSDFEDCRTGACHTDNTSSAGSNAYCEAECIEGTYQCGTAYEEDDQVTLYPAQIACTNKGRYDRQNPTICAHDDPSAIETCIDKFGCAECNPGVTTGKPDVRCAVDEDGLPADPPAVQVCNNGHWDQAITCPGDGTSCVSGVCYSTEPVPPEGGTGGQGNPDPVSGAGGVPQQ